MIRRDAQDRMIAFFARYAGATLDATCRPTIDGDDNLVVCGAPAELEKVRAWAHGLGVQCTVEPVDASDPDFADWTVARISQTSATRALRAAERATGKAR